MTTPFEPVTPGGDWRRNAVLRVDEDDLGAAVGYSAAGQALVEHWKTRGPNDGLFLPMVFVYRHALELVLKAAIREAAARLRRDGHQDPDLSPTELDRWLSSPQGAGHSLEALGHRLDSYLGTLKLENLPPDTHGLLQSLHQLDPKGDTFRYATVKDPVSKTFVPAPRPQATHVDVVAMGEQFDSAFSLLAGGVMTVLELYREYQEATAP